MARSSLYLTKLYTRLLGGSTSSFRKLSSSASTLSDAKGDHRNKEYDIIVTGGGMVGTAMAAALGHDPVFEGKRVLLLESGPQISFDEPPQQYSSRVCALSNSTRDLLSSFGAWEKILRSQTVKNMKIWDSCSDIGISFGYNNLPPQTSELACIVENDIILSAIVKQLLKTKVKIKYNSKVKSYELKNNKDDSDEQSTMPIVTLDNGDSFTGKLLIGADGVNSMLRRSANVKSVGWSYHQSAVVAAVQISGGITNDTAWQRFLPTGPIALLPLSNEFSCLIWTTTTEHAKDLVAMEPNAFVDSVNNAFNTDVHHDQAMYNVAKTVEGFLQFVGLGEDSIKQLPPRILQFEGNSRKTFPLGLHHASHYVRPRMALIGDAAHRVHPLSGQGVNLGFGDVACLTRVLRETVARGGDIGCINNLVAYETERQRRVLPMAATIDILDRFYSNEYSPLVLLRSIGCQVTNSLPFIKKQMVQFANY